MKSLLSIVVIALSMALPASAKQLFDGMSPYYTYLTESAIASEPQLSQKLKGAKSIEVVMFLGEPNADEIGKITQIIDNQKLDLINVTSNGESDIKAYGKPKGNKIKQLILTTGLKIKISNIIAAYAKSPAFFLACLRIITYSTAAIIK